MKQLARFLLVCALCGTNGWAQEPWTSSRTMQPKELAAQLSAQARSEVLVLFVGFPVLYRSAHIPGAILAGPCSKPEGLEALKKAVRDVPHSRLIAVYCGCCPFAKCPNVRPAYQELQRLGFPNVKVIVMDTNFHTDWVEKGFPVERNAASAAPLGR